MQETETGMNPCPGQTGRLLAAATIFLGLTATIMSPARAGEIYLNGVTIGGGGYVTVPVESFQEQKFKTTVHQEYDFSCGSAALATLLTYSYDIPSTEQTVFISMFEHGDKTKIKQFGFSLLDMKEYLDRIHLPSGGFRAPLSKLARVHLPAVVLINERGYKHFVVVRGIQDGRVLIADPSVGMRSERVTDFQREWSEVFFVILKNVALAQKSYNRPQDWATAPAAPLWLAKYAVDFATLQQQVGAIPSNFRF